MDSSLGIALYDHILINNEKKRKGFLTMTELLKGTKDVYYIGVDDREMDLFENQYNTPEGISYNSYLIRDEKCVVMDTADERVRDEWLANLEKALEGREPDYLVVSHMEPDHSACVKTFTSKYPKAKLIVNVKTLGFLKQFFGEDFTDRSVIVQDGEEFDTGNHTLKFIFAPMVHWPEVMIAYDKADKILFSADAFGTFGVLGEDIYDTGDDWAREASRYFINIVGKYGAAVSKLLAKVGEETKGIEMIAALHGPVISENVGFYIDKYADWSSYTSDLEGTFIVHASLHGNTKDAALKFGEYLKENGETVAYSDLTRDDAAAAVAKAFRFSKIALFSSTYEGDIMPAMNDFLYRLRLKGCVNKKIVIAENWSWGPVAAKKMMDVLGQMKGMEIVEPIVSIKTTLSDENREQLKTLAHALMNG